MSSFTELLNNIFEIRKSHFDRNLKKLLTCPSPCARIVFGSQLQTQSVITKQTTLDNFDTFSPHVKRLGKIKSSRVDIDTKIEEDEFASLLSHFKAVKRVHLDSSRLAE